MPRVKRGVTARARHKKVLDQAKGYRGRRKNVSPDRQAGGREGRSSTSIVTAVSLKSASSAPLDRPYQRGVPRTWPDLVLS